MKQQTPMQPKVKAKGFGKDDLIKLQLSSMSAMFAGFFVHPVDTVKIRMQLPKTEATMKYTSLTKSALVILKEEGIGRQGIYKGLSSSLLREGTYSGMRLGFYEPIKRALGMTDPRNAPIWLRFTAGAIGGCLASAIANPADIIKTRMQSQLAGVSKSLRWHVKDIYNTTGGLPGFYTGVSATILRGMFVNAFILGTYDTSKHTLMNSGYFEEGMLVQFLASTNAGFWVSVASSPADNIKTNLMTQRFDLPASPENPRYTGLVDCAKQMYKREGIPNFFKGFFPMWARFAPYMVISLVAWEQLRTILGYDNI